MTAWLATAVAIVASMTSGSSNTGAGQRRKKRLPSTGAAGQHDRRLPRIIQDQRRENHAPAQPDRRPAEMAEVSIERLRPGDAKEHAAEHQHDVATTGKQELQAQYRIEGP